MLPLKECMCTFIPKWFPPLQVWCTTSKVGSISGRLFWEHLSDALRDMGYVPNPDDLCVFNKDVNGKQCTVVLHVDDIKISHVEESVVRGVVDELSKTYGEMELRTGDVLEYCGITIDYSEKGSVKVSAKDYILEVIEEFPEEVGTFFKTPAARHLFDVDAGCEKLDEKTRQIFHSIFAKLL